MIQTSRSRKSCNPPGNVTLAGNLYARFRRGSFLGGLTSELLGPGQPQALRGLSFFGGANPDELRHVLMGMKDDLQFAQPKWDEGRPVDTLKITDDEDAKAIAHRILELYRELGTACCVEFARARPAPVARNLCRSRTWSRNQAVKRRALCAATWLDFCNPPIGQRMSKDGMPLLIRELHGKGFCAFTDV